MNFLFLLLRKIQKCVYALHTLFLFFILASNVILFSEARSVRISNSEENYAHALNLKNFDSTLASLKMPWALVEFYANWCPACQHFKPEYERVAQYFNELDTPHSNTIYVAKVDCADEGDLCTRFGIDRYPSMIFGKPVFFSKGNEKSRKENGPLVDVTADKKSEAIIQWINIKSSHNFIINDAKEAAINSKDEKENKISEQKSLQNRAELHDIEEATAIAFDNIFSSMKLNSNSRSALTQFLSLISSHHPSQRCSLGSKTFLNNLDQFWPLDASNDGDDGDENFKKINKFELKEMKICGHGFPKHKWKSCESSIPDRRGFTCGLWTLFHSFSVRLNEDEGALFVSAILSFVKYFFPCGECSQHFLTYAQQTNASQIISKREAVMWIWTAHNKVNKRLKKEEEESKGQRGDPSHPKTQFPNAVTCPPCHSSNSASDSPSWDLDEVYKFLLGFYEHPAADPDDVPPILVKEARSGPGSGSENALETSAEEVAAQTRARSYDNPFDHSLVSLSSLAFLALSLFGFYRIFIIMISGSQRHKVSTPLIPSYGLRKHGID